MRKITVILFLFSLNIVFAQNKQVEEPIKNFDRLWNVFNDKYANFRLKQINWNEIYTKYRPLINESTTNDSLFEVCNQMLLELKDGHVNLIAYGKKGKIIAKSNDGSPSTFLQNFPNSREKTTNIFQLLEITDRTLKDYGCSNLVSSRKGTLEYCTSKQYGYLRILSMGNLSLGEYRKFIDDAIDNFVERKGVIIDVRFNGGGDDKVSLTIANRFADNKRIAFYKKERKKGTSNFNRLQTKHIEPDGDKQFTKPLIVLTSDLTASAAEVFTMAMKELPYVTVIGDHTNGIFSDMYNFKLPNGWLVTLSHQQYFSSKMENYEGNGIEPDIKLMNTPSDIAKGIDPLVERGIQVLDKTTMAGKSDN